jgi:hypothetical protein
VVLVPVALPLSLADLTRRTRLDPRRY